MYYEIIILTGGSKGLGKSILDILLSRKDLLIISISRSELLIKQGNYKQIHKDLSHLNNCEDVISILKAYIDTEINAKKITLINNAARLGAITSSLNTKPEDTAKTIFLNLTAPILLQNAIIHYASNTVFVEIVNILSGAAAKPYYGWAAYCSTKAGLQMATKVLAIEIETLHLNAKVWGLKPAVIDTDMQKNIRASSQSDFKDVDRFIHLKKDNALLSPDFVAGFIVTSLSNPSFVNGEIYDIKDFIG